MAVCQEHYFGSIQHFSALKGLLQPPSICGSAPKFYLPGVKQLLLLGSNVAFG